MLLQYGGEISESCLIIEKNINFPVSNFSLFLNIFLVGFLQVIGNNGVIDANYDSSCLSQSIANKKNKLLFLKVFCLFRNL